MDAAVYMYFICFVLLYFVLLYFLNDKSIALKFLTTGSREHSLPSTFQQQLHARVHIVTLSHETAIPPPSPR